MEFYEFGEFSIDVRGCRLLHAGQPIALEPKCFDLLLLLVSRAGTLVSKEELYQKLWGGHAVSPGVLTRCVWITRRAIGDDGREQRLIVTHAKRGYSFRGEVRPITPSTVAKQDERAEGARPAFAVRRGQCVSRRRVVSPAPSAGARCRAHQGPHRSV